MTPNQRRRYRRIVFRTLDVLAIGLYVALVTVLIALLAVMLKHLNPLQYT